MSERPRTPPASATGVGSLLFGVSFHDLATHVGAVLLIMAIAALAGSGPARRAARIEPAQALRSD